MRSLALTLICAAMLATPALGQRIYVDASASGAGDGSSWTDAFTNLQDALAAARATSTLELWVADGTYRPDLGAGFTSGNRSHAFVLDRIGFALYGGFAGGETMLSQRDIAANPTILDGDLAGDDGPAFANYADNSIHVVTVTQTATLDGFTVRGGNANGLSGGANQGGGMQVLTGPTITVANCTFRENTCTDAGGAIFCFDPTVNIHNSSFLDNFAPRAGGAIFINGAINPRFKRIVSCSFISNSTGSQGGGGIGGDTSRTTIANSVFINNSAGSTSGGGTGGGVGVAGATGIQTAVINCTFAANTTSGRGGAGLAVLVSNGQPTISNSVFWQNQDNTAADERAQIDRLSFVTNPPIVRSSLVQGLSAFAGNNNIDGDPLFSNLDGCDDVLGNADDDVRLQSGSPALDAGDATFLPPDTLDLDADADTTEPLPVDRDGNTRVQNGQVDMGAYEGAFAPSGDVEITCPADATVECGGDTSSTARGSASAIDTCSGLPVTPTHSDSFAPGCGNTGVITRTWTADNGVTPPVSCVQTITIVDTTDPVLTVPADTTVECDASTAPADTGTATASDACDTAPSVSYSDTVTAGACPQESVITRTWTATDACGNSASADQTITVVDTTAPVLTLPADVTVECGASTDPMDTGSATAADNCDPAPAVSYSDTVTPGSCAGEEVITRTWTATDACGNSASADQTITVVDNTPPVITVDTTPITVVDVDCSGDEAVSLPVATASDDCDPAVTVTNDAPAAFAAGQATVVTFTATDACGNSSSASVSVTVLYGANIEVRAVRHSVGAGSRPGVNREPLVGIEVCAYETGPGSCAWQTCGGTLRQHFTCIADNCTPAACGITDANGQVTLNVPPGDYVVFTQDVGGLIIPDALFTIAQNVDCGETQREHLRQIVLANGRRTPGRCWFLTGSELLIVEPEYVIWDDVEQPYPFVLDALGDWVVTVSVEPPEGFVADHDELTEDVESTLEAVQFTITEVGSDLVPTRTSFDVLHNGRRIKIDSNVGIFLTPDYAVSRGFDVEQLRRKGLIVEKQQVERATGAPVNLPRRK